MSLAGCGLGGEAEPEAATLKLVEGFAGLAAAEEPRATVVGRELLGSNGNAVDAAVAMGFAMAVTMPSRAGLGGGGACVVHRRRDERQEAIVFLPSPGAGGGQVPGLPRGLAALHARYGSLPWSQVVAPAERLARFGAPVSRAFRADLAAAAGRLAGAARERFTTAAGELPQEGDSLRQTRLASVLSGLRSQGAAYFYGGAFAERLAGAATAAGQPFSVDELRAYVPRFVEPLRLAFGSHDLLLPPPPAAGALVAAQTWAMAVEAGAADMDGGERLHLLAEAGRRALAERSRWLEPGGGSRVPASELLAGRHVERLLADYRPARRTPPEALAAPDEALAGRAPAVGLAVADRYGNVVACAFTMNGLFGAGRTAEGTGVLLAGAPGPSGPGLDMAPAVVANRYTNYAYAAATATGAEAPSALVQVLVRLDGGKTLARAVAAPRIAPAETGGAVAAERRLAAERRRALERRGHRLVERDGLGRVVGLYCPKALPNSPKDCQATADPRGHGLAQRAE